MKNFCDFHKTNFEGVVCPACLQDENNVLDRKFAFEEWHDFSKVQKIGLILFASFLLLLIILISSLPKEIGDRSCLGCLCIEKIR